MKGYDEKYLQSCIDKAKKSWEGVDTDKFMNEIRGREGAPSEELDNAAEEYAYTNWESEDYHEGASEGLPFDPIGHTEKCFKAGAEWQRKQPAPTCKSCGFYENNCPFIRDTFKPYPNKVCKDYTYSVMKEQPEVNLEKEITRWLDKGDITDTRFDDYDDADIERTARHFYELGQRTKYQQDRAEFAKLKAKEWQSGYDEGYMKGINARKEGEQ